MQSIQFTSVTSHCANPNCAIPLRLLRDGRLFQFEVRQELPTGGGPRDTFLTPGRQPRNVSHFWLCGRCASTLTLVFDLLKGVIVKPRPAS